MHRRTLKRKFLDIENTIRHSLKVFGIKLGLVSRGKLGDAVMAAVAGDTLLEGLCGAMLAAREALWAQVERSAQTLPPGVPADVVRSHEHVV